MGGCQEQSKMAWWSRGGGGGAVSHEQLEPGPGGEKVVPAGSSCLLRPFIAPYWQ